MRVGQQIRGKPGRGVEKTPGRRRIVVEFDQGQFDSIYRAAERHGTSFAEQVRTLCEWALEMEDNEL